MVDTQENQTNCVGWMVEIIWHVSETEGRPFHKVANIEIHPLCLGQVTELPGLRLSCGENGIWYQEVNNTPTAGDFWGSRIPFSLSMRSIPTDAVGCRVGNRSIIFYPGSTGGEIQAKAHKAMVLRDLKKEEVHVTPAPSPAPRPAFLHRAIALLREQVKAFKKLQGGDEE